MQSNGDFRSRLADLRRRPEKAWPGDRTPLIVMAVITVVGICALIAVISDNDDRGPPPRALIPPAKPSPRPAPTTPSPPPSPSSTTTTPEPAARVALFFPRSGTRLDDDRDFFVGGFVRNLRDDDLRIFIYAERRRTFYLADYRAEDVEDGRWTIRSTGIGLEWGGDNDSYLVQAVTADPVCQERLDGLLLGNDRYPAFAALPEGCRVRAQVRVIEFD